MCVCVAVCCCICMCALLCVRVKYNVLCVCQNTVCIAVCSTVYIASRVRTRVCRYSVYY